MDRKNAKELLPIIKAYADGKSIEVRNHNIDDDKWKETDYPSFEPSFDYRIKPESKYRPFKDADECWNEMLKHKPFGLVIEKEYSEHFHINSIGESGVGGYTYRNAFKEIVFADGTPFGIKEGGDE